MQHFGERLKAARRIKGWSLQDLADSTEQSISKQALSKYEAGTIRPSRKIMMLLAEALKVKPSYFDRQPAFKLPEFELPRKSTIAVKQLASIREQIKDELEHHLQVESLLAIRPKFINPIRSLTVPDQQAAAKVASKLLNKWDLGWGALHNVTATLEDKGIRMIQVDSPETFDSLSTYVGKIPVIVLQKDRPTDIQRFTAMYELGRLLLNFTADADKDSICTTFAGSMFLPEDTLQSLLGNKRMAIAPGELMCIKEQYGLPMQAIMEQAIFKGIIERKNAGPFFRLITDNKDERGMGNYPGQEKAHRLERMIYRLVAEDIIDVHKAADLARLPVEELQRKRVMYEIMPQAEA
jgi:transcriptional regulator with XRE-family HTH domain